MRSSLVTPFPDNRDREAPHLRGAQQHHRRRRPQFGGALGVVVMKETSRFSPRSSTRSWGRSASCAPRAGGRPSTGAPRPGTAGPSPTTPAAPPRSSAWSWPPAASGCPGAGPDGHRLRRRPRGAGPHRPGPLRGPLPAHHGAGPEDDDLGYQPDLWAEMAGLDWLGLTYPESLGGSGAGVVDLAAIYREFGRTLVPSPHLASAVVVGEVLSREPGTPGPTCSAMVSGQALVVPALVEPEGGFGPEAVTLRPSSPRDGCSTAPSCWCPTPTWPASCWWRPAPGRPRRDHPAAGRPADPGGGRRAHGQHRRRPLFAVTFEAGGPPTRSWARSAGLVAPRPALDRATVLRWPRSWVR